MERKLHQKEVLLRKGCKRERKCSQKGAKETKRSQEGAQRDQKGAKREPKETQSNQMSTQIRPKIGLGARVDFGSEKGGSVIYFFADYNLDKWIWIDLWSHFGSIFSPSWDAKMLKKRWFLLCFRDLGDSKIDPKIDAGKKASKWLSGAQGGK